MKPILTCIPEELRERTQWVVWRYIKRGDSKPTKIPFTPVGDAASSTDSATWATFERVVEAIGFDGIGYVFSTDDPFVGIDLDNSIGEDGKLKGWAQKIVDYFQTYTEVSPSGKGVKLWCKGKYPSAGTGKRRAYQDGVIEMYHCGRYFTVTGQLYPNAPGEIAERQKGIERIFALLNPPSEVAMNVEERCKRYIEKCPDAVSGESGHDKTLRAACECFRFGLSESETRRVMDWFNASKCSPQWSHKELEHKINDARCKVTESGELGMRMRDNKPFRIQIAAPPKDSSGLLKVLNETISGQRKNMPWGWSVLTRMARALLPGTVTVLSGMGGSSKSLLISEACLFWLAQEIPFAVFHLEEDREFHGLRALAQLEGKAQITHDDWVRDNPDETQDCYERHQGAVNAIGQCIWDAPSSDVGLSDLTTWLKERAGEGRRVIVIDPVTAADSGSEPWRADRQFVLNAKRVLRDSGASLVVVTHPRDGNPKHGNRLDNHAGGQAYNRFTQCVLNLSAGDWRDSQIVDPTPMGTIRTSANLNRRITIHKARNGMGTGWDIGYWFDSSSLRFIEKGAVHRG